MINAEMKVVRFGENNVIATSFHCPNRLTNEHVKVTGTWDSVNNIIPTIVYQYDSETGTWSQFENNSYEWYAEDDTPVIGQYYYWGGADDNKMYNCSGSHQ